MPSKVFESLASGVPVVVSDGCEGAALVRQFDAGRTFRPGNPENQAAVLVDLAKHSGDRERMERNGVALARRFDRDRIAQHAEAVLKAVVEGGPLPDTPW